MQYFSRFSLKKWAAIDGFLWTDRGPMRGNRGSMTVAFLLPENMQVFELYLQRGVEIDSTALQRPFAALN
jgi:hypothetical protein